MHHIVYDDEKYNSYRNKIEHYKQDDQEIIHDIDEILNELDNNVIIVGHILDDDDNSSDRFLLNELLSTICSKKDLIYIDPRKEIHKINYTVKQLVKNEVLTAHYNDLGIQIMKNIYKDYIDEFFANKKQKKVTIL